MSIDRIRRRLSAVLILGLAAIGLPLGAESASAEDPGGWFVTIEQSPANPVPSDSPVTVTVSIATSDDGTPVPGVPVDFHRGPDPGETIRQVTDDVGRASYVLQLTVEDCSAIVSALIRHPEDETIIEQVNLEIIGGCEPLEPEGGLTGRSSPNGKWDVLKLRAATWQGFPIADASADLFRLSDDRWHQVGGRNRVLDARGKAVFRVRDRNHRGKTVYKAVFGDTETTMAGETRELALR